MKPVKNFVLAALFVSALALNTYAGDLDTPGFVPPPPPPDNSRVMVSTSEIPNSGVDSVTEESTSEAADKLFYDALMAMLSLF